MRSTRRPGFTLVELMVVIALILLLVALLVPALGSARESGRRASCQSRQRQIAIGSLLYAHEQASYLPTYSQTTTDEWGHGEMGYWVGRVFNHVSRVPETFRCPSYRALPGRSYYVSGVNDKMQGIAGHQNGDLAIVGQPGLRLPFDYGVFFNGVSMVRDGGTYGINDPIFPRLGHLEKAPCSANLGPFGFRESNYPLFAEARHYWNRTFLGSLRYLQTFPSEWTKVIDGLANADSPPYTPYYTTYLFSTLHAGGSGVAFADGHVEHFSAERMLREKPY